MKFKLIPYRGILTLVLIIIFTTASMAAKTLSTKGSINEKGQFVSDTGSIYDIAESEKGDELSNLVGEIVLVKGTFIKADGTRLLTVETYEIIEGQPVEQEISIKGTINENEQLVGNDGVTYNIADNEAGGEIITLIGERVAVKGTVADEDGAKVLSIDFFEKIEK